MINSSDVKKAQQYLNQLQGYITNGTEFSYEQLKQMCSFFINGLVRMNILPISAGNKFIKNELRIFFNATTYLGGGKVNTADVCEALIDFVQPYIDKAVNKSTEIGENIGNWNESDVRAIYTALEKNGYDFDFIQDGNFTMFEIDLGEYSKVSIESLGKDKFLLTSYEEDVNGDIASIGYFYDEEDGITRSLEEILSMIRTHDIEDSRLIY